MPKTIALLPLHKAQQAIYDCPARFRVACCGRRFGKGIEAVDEELTVGLRGGNVWHVSPTFPDSQIHWRLLRYVGAQLPGVQVRESDMMLTMRGGYIQVRSANTLLRGEGLDLAVIDEAAHTPNMRELWQGALRPALSDRRGRAIFYSTPFGLDFFWQLYGLGIDPERPDWQAFRFPTASNPYIPPEEIEAARNDLPDRIFREEYEAQFLDDSTGVFRFVDSVCSAEPQAAPMDGHEYVAGLDWGRSNDFTALSIIDTTDKREVALDRFTGIGYAMQRDRLRTLYDQWRPWKIIGEANSIGGPNIEALQADGLPVEPFWTDNASKAEIIEGLALAFEKKHAGVDGGVTLLNDPVGCSELKAYDLDRLPSGKYRYGARSGSHDDTVIARALSWHGAQDSGLWWG